MLRCLPARTETFFTPFCLHFTAAAVTLPLWSSQVDILFVRGHKEQKVRNHSSVVFCVSVDLLLQEVRKSYCKAAKYQRKKKTQRCVLSGSLCDDGPVLKTCTM